LENGGSKNIRESRAAVPSPRARSLALLRLVARVPLRVAHAVGIVLGWMMYGSPTYRRHLRENLALAGYGRDGRVRRAAIGEAGKAIAEVPKIFFGPRLATLAMVRAFEGLDHLRAALAAKKGIVLLVPHFGCFEIAGRAVAELCPLTALYRPPKIAWVQALLEHGRVWPNARMAPASLAGVRSLLSALKRGEAIFILPDQVPGEGEGEWVPFFGRPAYTMTLAARLAGREDAVCLVLTAERLRRAGGFTVRVRPLPEAAVGETIERRINRAIEEAVRERPEQYLWGYNRYKRPRGARPPQKETA
jgi:KDO2-lipid IV(A) lauroyltransferase